MRVTLESTDRITDLITPEGGTMPARLWEGHTASGIAVQVLVTRIAVSRAEDITAFAAELVEQRPPSPSSDAFPLRVL